MINHLAGAAKYIQVCILMLSAMMFLGRDASAAPGTLLLTFYNPTPGSADQFGFSVAAVGNNILAGAPHDSTSGNTTGAAYLMDGTTGAALLTINDPTPAVGDWFGYAVAAVGNNILVGALHDRAGALEPGSAYLFDGTLRGTTNTPLLTINNPTPAGGYFGGSLAGIGNNILVGAWGNNTGSGSAYLFNGALRGTTSTPLLTINNPTPGGSAFGYSVSTVGTNILIGANGGGGTGAAYIFDGALIGTTNTPLLTINDPSPTVGDGFGVSVAGLGNNVLVGAPYDNTGAVEAGSAYLFDGTLTGTTNTPLLTINDPSPVIDDNLGNCMAALGNNILVGAWLVDAGAPDAGSAYIFDGTLRGTTSTPLLTINNPTPGIGDGFGVSVAALGNNVLVGAPYDNEGVDSVGAAYLFCGVIGACAVIPTPTPNAVRDWKIYE